MQEDSTLGTNQAMKQLQRAQQTLSKVQHKLRSLQKQKIQSNKRQQKAPMPDLSKYLSILRHEQEQQMPVEIFQRAHYPSRRTPIIQSSKKQRNKPNFNKWVQEETNHNQIQIRKNQNMQKLQNFYQLQSEQMEEKIKKINKQIQKIKRDKVLLGRDNQQLQTKINLYRQVERDDYQSKGELTEQIYELKRTIALVQEQNRRIIERKEDLQNNFHLMLKSQKPQIEKQHKIKQSNSIHSKNRCPYH